MGRILIVEDEDTIRRPLMRVLKIEGHEVRTATGGREGIEIGTRFGPQVMIADWRVPDGVSGLQVAEALQRLNPGLRTIMITGHSVQELKREAEIEVFRIIEKPFDLDELLDIVQQALAAPVEKC